MPQVEGVPDGVPDAALEGVAVGDPVPVLVADGEGDDEVDADGSGEGCCVGKPVSTGSPER